MVVDRVLLPQLSDVIHDEDSKIEGQCACRDEEIIPATCSFGSKECRALKRLVMSSETNSHAPNRE